MGRCQRDHLRQRLEADLREQAHANRTSKMEERLLVGSEKLAPLAYGDTVIVQNQASEKTG